MVRIMMNNDPHVCSASPKVKVKEQEPHLSNILLLSRLEKVELENKIYLPIFHTENFTTGHIFFTSLKVVEMR